MKFSWSKHQDLSETLGINGEEWAWLLSESPCLCRSRCEWHERWHQKVEPHQILIVQLCKPKPEQFQLGPNRQNWKMWLSGQDSTRKTLKLQDGTKICEGLFGADATPFLPISNNKQKMVQNFETPPAAADNSSWVSKIAKQKLCIQGHKVSTFRGQLWNNGMWPVLLQ